MSDENTQNPPAGDPNTGKPEANSQPTPEQLKAENEKLKRENAEAAQRLADKDSHITRLTNVNSTLEQRFKATTSQDEEAAAYEKEAAVIMAEAQENPEAAGKKLAGLIKKAKDSGAQTASQAVDSAIERRTKIEKIRSENQDLMELGLEPAITIRANELIQQGKTLDEAAKTACTEFRDRLKDKFVPKPKQDSSDSVNQGAPGAQGETGGSNSGNQNPPASSKETKTDLTSEDSRTKRLAATGLY